MPISTKQERKAWILEAQSLIGGGKSGAAVIKIFVEQHGISQRTAVRYVNAAWREWNLRRIYGKRDHRISRALARVDRAAEIAINHKRHLVVGGEVESVNEPDAKALLAAVDTEAKILGLFAPERREIIVQHFQDAVARFVRIIHEEVTDPHVRERLRTRTIEVFTAGANLAAKAIEKPEEIVIDAIPTPNYLGGAASPKETPNVDELWKKNGK